MLEHTKRQVKVIFVSRNAVIMHLSCLSPQFAFSFFLTIQNYRSFLPTYEVMYFKPFSMLC